MPQNAFPQQQAQAAVIERQPRRASGPTHLTLDNVVQYLLDRGLIDASRVVDTPDGVLTVLDYSRRNRNFKVLFPDGSGLLVKQAMDTRQEDFRKSLNLESSMLNAIVEADGFRELRAWSPRFVHFDRLNLVLITDLIHPATTYVRFHLNGADVHFPPEAATTAGRILARAHVGGARALADGDLPWLEVRTPFVWKAMTYLNGAEPNSGAGKLLAHLREAPFWGEIPRLQEAWERNEALVHLDPRWDNFLLTHGDGHDGGLNARLIDWELAGKGDLAWDIAYYLCEYIRFWIINAVRRRSIRTVAEFSERPIFSPDLWREATQSFWEAYHTKARLSPSRSADLLRRVHAYLPFTMTVHAYEAVPAYQSNPWVIDVAMELAGHAHKDPAAFMKTWFGIEEVA